MLRDFKRFVFDAIKKYTRVLRQQGRVQLDPDVKEDAKPLPAEETQEPPDERER